MKMTAFRTLMCIAVTTLLATALEFPVRLAAQDTESQNHGHKHVRYVLKVLSTLGGTAGVGNSVNNKGWVAGAANLTGDTTEHAALWRNGVITDLGTLGGPDSFINTPVKNERGEIEGFSETSTPDPLGEEFCAGITFFGFHDGVTCLGFVWRDGVMAPLPPLAGGNNSQASGINNRGQVVGFAENGTQDASCTPPQILQFEAVIWGPKKGQIQQLPPLSGDPDGIGVAINDEGEVTGCTGVCANVGGASCTHAVVWKHGSPRDIGGLGPLNFGEAINNRGQVLGLSLLPDGATFHSFLWQKGAITDLGTLPGNPLTFPGGINNKGQVVGHSCDVTDTFCVAYIWEKGVMTDLNTLVPPGLSVSLYYAGDINDRGEIAGIAEDPVTGEFPAFVAIPCDEEGHPGVEGCDYSMVDAASTDSVSPAPASQHPPASPLHSRMLAGMLNRFRFPSDQRALGSGPSPITERKPELSANGVTDYLEADHRLGQEPFGHHLGYCGANSSGLTGYCTAYSFYSCLAKLSSACPKGQKAKKPGYFLCSNTTKKFVDLGRSCSF